MPKNKSKQQCAKAATDDANDDFDRMLAEVTAADLRRRTHCAKPGCDGAGKKTCADCLKVYYCTRQCQLAHWPAHKAECRQSAGMAAI
jgi:hypothetical protein